MAERHDRDRGAYWLQLVLAMGIATYGLVLGSTGVVIGAMLVSPLMGPLVEIGMGLVTGSALLVLQATIRTALSIALVVGASATLTSLLPYHELTSEIAARTAPTLLDLYVASFCALAAAYTTARQSPDTVSAAAGTAISIALVPPLCVVGWGVGAGQPHVAAGAALLFTANLCAILLFTAALFLVLGFEAVGVDEIAAPGAGTVHRLATRVHHLFGAKYGPLLRVFMPIVLVASVFVPLRRALHEVAWKTRARAEVEDVISHAALARDAMRSVVSVEHHAIALRLFVVCPSASAEQLERHLRDAIVARTGVAPTVQVTAVADERMLRAATEDLAARAPEPPKPAIDLDAERATLDRELRAVWPEAAGDLLRWHLTVAGDGDASELAVVHQGAPLGPAGAALLGDALQRRVSVVASVRDLALPVAAEERSLAERDAWTDDLARTAALLDRAGLGRLCVRVPESERRSRDSAALELAIDAVRTATASLDPARVEVTRGGAVLRFRVATGACEAPADAGAPDAGSSG
jgi:uncharacterized hydrophobic protein (TIGR00271 family)